jgi:hypothetical protein
MYIASSELIYRYTKLNFRFVWCRGVRMGGHCGSQTATPVAATGSAPKTMTQLLTAQS